jgi:gas vesicle protein
MNRTLKRPMFRMGGAAEGITSGLDRKPLKEGTDPYDRAIQTTDRFESDMDRYKGEQAPLMPGGLPNFLTSFGLNLMSQTPRGKGFSGLLSTAATAAKEPFQTFQAANLAERQDRQERLDDIFSTSLASEYDLEAQRIKNLQSDEKTFAKQQAANAVSALYDSQVGAIKNKIEQLDQANDPDYLEKINDYNKQIKDIEDRKKDDIKSIYLSQDTTTEFQRDAILKLLQNNDIEDIAPYFPNFDELMGGIKLPEAKADGGRIGYKIGTPRPMMETVVEEKKETGEVQDLSYTELRSRLPQEISNEIVMLLANSKQALLDFANIQTGEDVSSFNQQYDVNLTLPQGA